MEEPDLVEKLKSHLRFEEGMDNSLLSFYIDNAKDYVTKATGSEKEYLVIMVAGIMFEYRVSEKELGEALDALTPFFVQEAFSDEETDK
ncbi:MULTISPECIES: head-tail connector protein [Lactococcus]|uniref:head-tail connector protein n=1 Tax=Lactococcus TaxID=1357 RepID=UPI0014300980|nr:MULTISPECIES: head-tail connector protein [Lactococcus]KAF6609682.1 phage head-tail connector protein [Lactococcus sp. EKM201L]KAF6613690.1 phage head-tail connector protein [Lactococcus sp. EKM203L]KAF6640683.1 phage head-tail connector protein [Lactococcus sp. EKM501L]KAF6645947.1 phage head-tail connector protein [Lactococcus sp. EKM502L]KAF6651631.1 phage head-tail connector protein [Lactococcus sp. EKM101L]